MFYASPHSCAQLFNVQEWVASKELKTPGTRNACSIVELSLTKTCITSVFIFSILSANMTQYPINAVSQQIMACAYVRKLSCPTTLGTQVSEITHWPYPVSATQWFCLVAGNASNQVHITTRSRKTCSSWDQVDFGI